MKLGALECSCGARIVGDPLDEIPIKVKRFGPVMTAVAALAAVIIASLVVTSWMALGGILVIWSARRAVKLGRRDPEGFGGYRVAVGTLSLALVSGGALLSYAISRIPEYLRKQEIRRVAATESAMMHGFALLEDYKNKNGGSLLRDEEAMMKAMGQPMPTDYWENRIRYRGYVDQVAEAGDGPVIHVATFELRSPGPDGKIGTADDIVMRNGIFLTPEEVAREALAKTPGDR